jgi:hypothetical protein
VLPTSPSETIDGAFDDVGILVIEMANIMIMAVMVSLLQGVPTTAQATTEELLTELDKPSE